MARQYHYLVASLRDYALEGAEKDFDAFQIRDYVRENLSGQDLDTLCMFYTYYDIENIVSVATRSNRFNNLGNFTLEELDDEVKKPESLPRYLGAVIEAYNNPEANENEDVDTSRRLERSLYEAYYREAAKSQSRFVREWTDFDRTLRNLCAAIAARKANRPAEDVVVGDDAVTAAISRSTASDFGLKGELDYIDAVMQALTEEDNILEKERKLDALRWKVVDDMTTFEYFSLDAVLAYLIKVNLVYRWRQLDPQTGREMFSHLLDMLSGTGLFEWIDRKSAEEQIEIK